jgi:hypothetical protein
MVDPVSYRFDWRVPESVTDDLRPLAEEIIRRGRRNEDLGDTFGRRARRWVGLNYLLGAPAAMFAAIAGAITVVDPKRNLVAGVLALTAAGLGALMTFLTPAARAAGATTRATAHWRTSIWVRTVVTAELPFADLAGARALLAELQAREDAEIVASAESR